MVGKHVWFLFENNDIKNTIYFKMILGKLSLSKNK